MATGGVRAGADASNLGRGFRRYLSGFEAPFGAAGFSIAGSVVRLALLLPIPLLVRHLFEGRVVQSSAMSVGATILALEVAAITIGLWTRRRVLSTITRRGEQLRLEALRRLDDLPAVEHARPRSATLHDRIVNETRRIEQMTFVLLADLIPSIVIALGVAAVLCVLDARLFVVALLLLPLNVAALRILGRATRQATQRYHGGFEAFSGGVLRALRALELTRILGAERWLARRLREDVEHLGASTRRNLGLAELSAGVQQGLTAATSVIVLVAGGLWVGQGSLDMAVLIAFFAGLALLRGPLTTLATSLAPLIEGLESLATIEHFFDDIEDQPYTGRGRIDFQGHVRLRNVGFGYTDRRVLDDVSLELHPGEVVAIVGPNGAGKTTIARLILGLVRPQSGSLSIDGVAYDELDLVGMRRKMGVLTQNPLLLEGTVWDNLTYGLEDPKIEDVDDVIRVVAAERLLDSLEQGYETPVGEDGARLSGGEGQQLALARALLGRPCVLLLDEPTRHLDETAVALFIESLRGRGEMPATLLISHDSRAVRCADRVFKLDAARLMGTAYESI